MSQIDPEEILQRIRAAIEEGRRTKSRRAFRPPIPQDFTPDVQILTFDQTLTHCGWALLNTEEDISIPESGTIRTPILGSAIRGFQATMAKSVPLSRNIADMLNRLYGQFEDVVLEMPAVSGYRTESSLIAAVTVCVELDRLGLAQPTFISRQAAGATLVNDRHAPKSVTSAFVNSLVEDRRPTGVGTWTEHVRDAVFVGLKHLHIPEET